MSNNSDLHVVFGTGAVGMAVIDELVARGKQVRAVNRSGQANLPAGVELMSGDASNPAFRTQAAAGAAVVYFVLNPPYTQWPELFPQLQAGVLAGAKAAGAKFVAMENLYSYGPTGGQPLTEDLPMVATTRKGKTRAQMTRDLLAAHAAGEVRVAIGRASDYFGPRGLEQAILGTRVIPPALAGKAAQVLGNPDLPHTLSYAPDIGRALVVLGTRAEADGEIWHLPNAPTNTLREAVAMVYEAAGQPVKIQAAPRLIVTLMACFNPLMREIKEMLYEFEEPFIVDDSKFRAAFGDAFQPTPLREAVQATVEWYRANPQS